MASSRGCSTAIIMFLVVLTVSSFDSVIGKPERRERHINDDGRTIEQTQSTDSWPHSSPNSLTSRDGEESVSLTGKRVSQRLMGGHLRYETTTISPIGDESDDESDEASWDDGLAQSSAGNGKERSTKTVNDDDDEKKTLSQQVKEGKYGLIQNEIYPKRPKRPGIVSYLSNPEVPRDNAKNLGGLDEDEIWLAENHVLVLRGGNFPDHEANRGINDGGDNKNEQDEDWRPIDDYSAPKRQVKIPSRPKVPPPFPVQLVENGPIRIIGDNDTTTSDGESTSDYENAPRQKRPSSESREGGSFNETSKDSTNSTRSMMDDGRTKSGHVPPRSQGVIGPFYPSLPPGAVFVVPPSNHTDYDEDDQSIYYPPPYSFYYKQDNSTPVPPGPLVPGIILPPPPDFFSGLEDKKPTVKQQSKYPKRTGTTPTPSRPSPSHYPPRKGTSKVYKSTTSRSIMTTTKYSSPGASFTMKPLNAIKYKSTTTGGRSTLKPIRVQDVTSSFVEVTTPSISEASNLKVTEFYGPRTNDYVDSKTEKRTTTVRTPTTTGRSNERWNDVSSKSVPLVRYYSSSTPSSIDEPIEATPISSNSVITTDKQRETTNQASYYFYEEANDDVVIRTTPNPTIYYRTTTEAPYYNDDSIGQRVSPKIRDREKNSYGLELLQPVSKTSPRYQYADSGSTVNSLASSRAKGHRMIAESSPVYYDDPITERPRDSQLKSYYPTTAQPDYGTEDQARDDRWSYDRSTKPKAIYQYSYEAADYYKRGKQQNYYTPENPRQTYYKQENAEPTRATEGFDEWQDIRQDEQEGQNQQYDYENTEILTERPVQPERENYRNRLPISYQSTTPRPPIEATPDPHHVYYTRQEEQLLDDVTREYFTNFGKKIRNKNLPNTTPIYSKNRLVTPRPDYGKVESFGSSDYEDSREKAANAETPPRIRVHYGDQAQRPYSLSDDIRVNYKDPLPPVEPASEWIPGYEPKPRVNLPIQDYRQHHTETVNRDYGDENLSQRLTPLRPFDERRIVEKPKTTNFVEIGDTRGNDNYPTRPITLIDDIAVNYRDPLPAINPDAEYIDGSAIRDGKNGEKASYFAYRLPGDGGHFYFLTPQAISQRQDSQGGYLYQRPRGARFSRQRRRGPRNAS